MAGKKNLAEEKELFHTGRRKHDNEPFWPQLGPVVFLAVIFLINFIARIILSPLLPTIEKELAISHGQAGSFFFLISGGYVIGLLGSGFLASRSSHKITIVISTAGVGLALLGISVVSSLWAIRVGLFGLGFAGGLYIPSAIATITSLIERPHWGKAIAVHELAPNLAFFAGPFVAELFLSWSTWRLALSSLGMASLVASLAYFRFGRGGEFPGESPASSAFGLLVRAPSFWIMVALFGLGVSSTIGVYAMLPLYLVSERQDRLELGQYGGCSLQVLWTDPGGSRGLGVGPFGSEADHGYEFNFHRNRHLAGGTGFKRLDQYRRLVSAAPRRLVFSRGVCRSRCDYSGRRPQSRGGLYNSFRLFDRWWRCPHFHRHHGRQRLLRYRFHGDGNSHFVRRHLGIVVEATGKIAGKHAEAPVVINTRVGL